MPGYDFFISHATPDREWAQWIAWRLEAAGQTTYLPIRDLRPGSDRRELEAAMVGSRGTVIVLSPDYLDSEACGREWRAIEARASGDRGPALVPVRVRDCYPTGRLGQLSYVDLVGLDERGAAEQLELGLVTNGRSGAAPPPFPSSVDHPSADEPQFPRDLSTLQHPIELAITRADVLDFRADVVAFKSAPDAQGASLAALERLGSGTEGQEVTLPQEGGYTLVWTRGRLASPYAMFIGVPYMRNFSYLDVKSLGSTMLETLAVESPRTAHLATTVHGPGVALDEVESLLSLVAGFLEALKNHRVPAGLERVTIVESRPERVEELGKGLERHLDEVPDASLVNAREGHWVFRTGVPERLVERAAALPQAPQIELLDRRPERKPHVFVAFPFKLPDHFRFGIQRPARDAGFLCEHFGEEAFMGDILDRVKSQIEGAAVVIGLLTGANPNVYLEVGYAWGKHKHTILLAEEGEELKFDVRGHRCLHYTTIGELEQKMTDELSQLQRQGVI